jgi:hypothetical protein
VATHNDSMSNDLRGVYGFMAAVIILCASCKDDLRPFLISRSHTELGTISAICLHFSEMEL